MLDHSRELVERSRTHVGNLAHALKTPLSVILNEVRGQDAPFAPKVAEQAEVMRSQVHHHLERARMAAQRRVIGVSCDVEPVLARLIRAMTRIHRDRGIDITLDMKTRLRFRGEEQDLEEMAGNLIDNACKWASSRVRVSVTAMGAGEGGERIVIAIADDGPGLGDSEMAEALKRGRRLDETVPGTGLGLSIVVDLAGLYGGDLALDRDRGPGGGGLVARLVLPAI